MITPKVKVGFECLNDWIPTGTIVAEAMQQQHLWLVAAGAQIVQTNAVGTHVVGFHKLIFRPVWRFSQTRVYLRP